MVEILTLYVPFASCNRQPMSVQKLLSIVCMCATHAHPCNAEAISQDTKLDSKMGCEPESALVMWQRCLFWQLCPSVEAARRRLDPRFLLYLPRQLPPASLLLLQAALALPVALEYQFEMVPRLID